MTIKQVPVEILIMILEMLGFEYAYELCQALNIPEELAFQYHHFNGFLRIITYADKIYDSSNRKVTRPNLAKALLKNIKFQCSAKPYVKLTFAILSQDLDLVRNALEGSRLNHEDKFNSPFQIACEYGQLDVVKLLVHEYGIKISAHDNEELWVVCRQGNCDIVKYIISHPDFNPVNVSRAFIPASVSKNANVIRLLLADPRFDPAYQNNRAVIDASLNGEEEIVKLLLADSRVDASDQANQAIISASLKGNINIVESLMSNPRVNPADQNNEAIKLAHLKGHTEILQMLRKDPRVENLWANSHHS